MTIFAQEIAGPDESIDDADLSRLIIDGVNRSDVDTSNIAVVPVDITRIQGRSGLLTRTLFNCVEYRIGHAFVALGSHEPHNTVQHETMFGKLPKHLFLDHDWRNGTVDLGEIPVSTLEQICGAKLDQATIGNSIPIQLNGQFHQGMQSGDYSCAIIIGVVFPHEVAGFSSGNKNIFVGLGGQKFIDASHWMMADYGIERTLGRYNTPMRHLMNLAEKEYLKGMDILYALTVITPDPKGGNTVKGFFVGKGTDTLREAAKLSGELNVHKLDEPVQNAVVYLDPKEYKSFWLGNKAVYRLRMAIADGGTLYVVAPGIASFADNPKLNADRDRLIESVGYRGTSYVRSQLLALPELRQNTSVAAHLIHASSEGRFNIAYLTDPSLMPGDKVERAGFKWGGDCTPLLQQFNYEKAPQGYQNIPGFGQAYYVPNPALTLLSTKARFKGR